MSENLPPKIVNKKVFKQYIKLRKKLPDSEDTKEYEENLRKVGFRKPSSWRFEELKDIHSLLKDYNGYREDIIKYLKKGKAEDVKEAQEKINVLLLQLEEYGYQTPEDESVVSQIKFKEPRFMDEEGSVQAHMEDLDDQFQDWEDQEKDKAGKS